MSARAWKAERFSWGFARLMHKDAENGEFGVKLQSTEQDCLFIWRAAQTALAQHHVGLVLWGGSQRLRAQGLMRN